MIIILNFLECNDGNCCLEEFGHTVTKIWPVSSRMKLLLSPDETLLWKEDIRKLFLNFFVYLKHILVNSCARTKHWPTKWSSSVKSIWPFLSPDETLLWKEDIRKLFLNFFVYFKHILVNSCARTKHWPKKWSSSGLKLRWTSTFLGFNMLSRKWPYLR